MVCVLHTQKVFTVGSNMTSPGELTCLDQIAHYARLSVGVAKTIMIRLVNSTGGKVVQ